MIWLRFRSPVVVSLFAVLIGLAAGLIIHTGKLPALNGLVEPVTSVGTLWLNCLRVVVIPMIVVFLISALVSHGDVRTTGKVGGGAFVLFCVMLAAASLFAGFFTTPLTRLVWGGGEAPAITAETAAESAKIAGDAAKAKVPGGTTWIRTLVPTNLFKAALEDDLIGLMLFAAMFAFALKHTSGEASQT